MRKTYLEPAEVDLLERNALTKVHQNGRWALVPCLRDQLLIRILFRCAVRVSEALGLRVPEDVDLEGAAIKLGPIPMVHIIRQKERLRLFCPACGVRLAKAYRFCPGCGQEVAEAVKKVVETRRERTVPLDPETTAMLREFIMRGGPRDGRLFLIGRSQAWNIVHQAARRAGLGPLTNPETGREHGVSPHRLRDAFATLAMQVDDSGDGQRKLQELMGHKDFNTTARYRKLSGRELHDWYKKVLSKEGKDGPDDGAGIVGRP